MEDKSRYDHKTIEPKWLKAWEGMDLYRVDEKTDKPKKYTLFEFPYPSGDRLHVGHAFSFTGTDVFARFNRMKGFNVLCPMGWDAFGLPAENYAIKTGINPMITTAQNIATSKEQAKRWALSIDWSREVSTTDPKYYRWTQWIFLQWYKKGLAYKKEMPINWCPSCKTGLANEEVVAGTCERCGAEATRRNIKQWVVKITDYADRLIDGLKDTNFIEKVKAAQINWIGRSEGAEVEFRIKGDDSGQARMTKTIKVFTTRPDTLYGATFMVLAPEHQLVAEILNPNIEIPALPAGRRNKFKIQNTNIETIREYAVNARKKSDMERTELAKEKTGVFSGLYAINPVTGKEIPVWISDFVLSSYGTGAIMAVPAHDERDFAFAKKFGLPIIPVIEPDGGWDFDKAAYTEVDRGNLINSANWSNLTPKEAIIQANNWLEEKGIGKKTVSYHLRDWIFSRQHYWGEPIPIVNCDKCGEVPVPEEQLPVELPKVEKYEPTDTGESPLALVTDWVNTTCPKCGSFAKRETDTMPNWAGSDWYYLAYPVADKLGEQKSNVKNKKYGDIFSENKEILKYWLPVDVYVGGDEHNTLHLLYSRFTYQFLYDLGVLPKEIPEPYFRRMSHGVILGPDNQRMSKSHGNVINPDEVVEAYGADAMRLYMMFMGPFDATMAWSQESLEGCARFLRRVWNLVMSYELLVISRDGNRENQEDERVTRKLHQTIKKVTEDLEAMKFNTAVAAMMELLNEMVRLGGMGEMGVMGRKTIETYLKLLAPFAPFMTEELWSRLGNTGSIHVSEWPKFDASLIEEDEVTIVVQVNGKTRDQFKMQNAKCKNKEEVEFIAREREKVKTYLVGEVKKVIFVPGKLVNFVVG